MTAPDDGLEEELRRALDAAASQVEPGDSGLERILARTSRTAPRPWLASTVAEAFRRVRHWTWRGHWAWQDPGYWRSGEWRSAELAVRVATARRQAGVWGARAWRPAAAGAGRARRRVIAWWARVWRSGMSAWLVPGATSPALRPVTRRQGRTWLRLAAGLAAAASVTAVTVAVPPLRAAFVQVGSTVLTSGGQALTPTFGGDPNGASGRPRGAGAVSGASSSTRPRGRSTSAPSRPTPGTGLTTVPAPCLSWLPITPTATAGGSADGGAGGAAPSASASPSQGITTSGTSPPGCPATRARSAARPTASVPASPAPTTGASATPTPTPSATPTPTSTPTPTASPSTSSTGPTASPDSTVTAGGGSGGGDSGNSGEEPVPTASSPASTAPGGDSRG
jgi:hypothetical protein